MYERRNIRTKIVPIKLERNVLTYDDKRINMLKKQLFDKVLTCFEQYSVQSCVEYDVFEMVDPDIVDVQMNKTSEQVYGTIVCIICGEKEQNPKPKRVFYHESDDSCYWVISNFQKHLTTIHHLKPLHGKIQNRNTIVNHESYSQKNASNNKLDSSCVNDKSLEIVSVENIDNHNNQTPEFKENWLYTQFANQVTEMIKSVLSNSDEEEYNVAATFSEHIAYLTVAKIPGDGNCLFGSIAHQLYRYPINSSQHKSATKALRAEVVDYILDNFSSFEFALQDRVFEINHNRKKDIENLQSEFKFYVPYVLSKDRQWAGHESVQAISNKYEVNIITFYEDGNSCVLHTNIHKQFERTIAIVYRVGHSENGSEIRNHYDSVSDIKSEDIWAATDYLIRKLK